MFMEAYGSALIKRLADAKKLLVASPLTSAFVGQAGGPRSLAVTRLLPEVMDWLLTRR
jgi:hypothetical protein